MDQGILSIEIHSLVPKPPPHALSGFPAKGRPEQEARQTDGVPQTLPQALSSLLSLLIHLFGWIRSCMEPR